MRTLSKEFVEQCPEEGGFHLRGLEMTRLEVFVDAAFAFSVTLLVISFDSIPSSYEEMVKALKGIPAFSVAVAQIVWIWHEHNVWSRRYGLEDAMSVVLSTALLIVVLIYIFPLRVMAQGMFGWMTNGFLPSTFSLDSIDELRFMFLFLGVGFSIVATIYALMYAHARRHWRELQLSRSESFDTRTVELYWIGFAFVGLFTVALALWLPEKAVPLSGFGYALLGLWAPWIYIRRGKEKEQKS